MLLFSLDQRSQLALIFAASVTSLAGCGDRTVVTDPMPGDAAPVDGHRDGRDGADVLVSDMLPPDAQYDRAQYDMPVPDPMPIDASGSDIPYNDPMPTDAAWHLPPHQLDPPPPIRGFETDPAARATRDSLPLPRGLNVRIARTAQPDGTTRFRAVTSFANPRLSYVWMASAGALSSTTAGEVVWTPPQGPGRHLVQVTVRDGERALAVDAVIEVR